MTAATRNSLRELIERLTAFTIVTADKLLDPTVSEVSGEVVNRANAANDALAVEPETPAPTP